MRLVDKAIKIISEVSEMFDGQPSLHPSVNCLIIVLEDLQSVLTDSILLKDRFEGSSNGEDSGVNDSIEDIISESTKYRILRNIESSFEACKSINSKNKSGIFKKVLHFIKNKLLEDPEEVLNANISELWQNML